MTQGPGELEARLRGILEERYHHRHPFNLRMHAGRLSREEIQTWVRNRYYYQTRIPIKDGLILAKSRDPAFRREWVQRIHDHDGERPGEGGLALWLALAEAVGLERADVEGLRGVLPGVRAACDAYVEFVSSHDLLESVASSLTELFAGELMGRRIAAFEEHYRWVGPAGLDYFRSRTRIAPSDAEKGLAFVREHARTQEDQERCAAALARKCEILWQLLDAIEAAHARPALVAHAELRRDPAGDATLAVLPERAVSLNPTGREVLALCDGERTAAEVAAELARRHAGAPEIASDVHRFLGEMERLGVLRLERRPA